MQNSTKLLLPFVMLAFLLGLSSCGSDHSSDNPKINEPNSESEVSDTDRPAKPQEPTPDKQPVPDKDLDKKPDEDIVVSPIAPAPDPINENLPITGAMCSSEDFGKGKLEACLKSEESMGLYGNIILQFSTKKSGGSAELVDKSKIEKNLELHNASGKPIPITMIWTDDRTIEIDPHRPLKENSNYTIVIHSQPGDVERPSSNKKRILNPFSKQIQSSFLFRLEHSLNGFTASSTRGIILDRNTHKNVFITSKITPAKSIKQLSIKKLGSTAKIILCGNEAEETCTSEITTKLSKFVDLEPEPGANTYVYEIVDLDGEVSTYQVSFNWGYTAKNSGAVIPKSLKVAMDPTNSFETLAQILPRLAAGKFTLDYLDGDEVYEAFTLNQIIAHNPKQYPAESPSPCQRRLEKNFSFNGNLGPFCNIPVNGSEPLLGGIFGSVKYKSTVDVFVTDMRIPEDEGNLAVSMETASDFLKLGLDIKRFLGSLKIVIHITEAKHGLGIPIPAAEGTFEFNTTFELNGPPRKAIAHSSLENRNGVLKIGINNIEDMDIDAISNGNANTRDYFTTQEWIENVVVSKPELLNENGGLFAAVVNQVVSDAVTKKVRSFTPGIVNGIARDMIQNVSSNTLNTLVSQIKKGITLPFPEFLPDPINKYTATVRGQLNGDFSWQNQYLTASLDGQIELPRYEGNIAPAVPAGTNSYVIYRLESWDLPSPLDGGLGDTPGPLVNINIDLINQTLFQFWQQGLLGFSLTETFITDLEKFAVFDPNNLNNGKEIFLAEFLPRLVGSRIDRLVSYDQSGNIEMIGADDDIIISLSPSLPPVLSIVNTNGETSENSDPKFVLSIGDLFFTIKGRRPDQQLYDITTVKLALESESKVSFLPYSNPMRLESFSGVGAVSVQVATDYPELDFSAEVLTGSRFNPFGLNTDKLKKAILDLVDTLFVPLFNDGLREVPLVGLRSCGIELDSGNMSILPIPAGNSDYIRLLAPLKTYHFNGNCSLEPDFTTPLPPLPDVDPVDPDPIDPDPIPGDGSELSMDFASLPFTPGETGIVPKTPEECQANLFFEPSCALAQVDYKRDENGELILDSRGRPQYAYSAIQLYALVSKDIYSLRLDETMASIEKQYFSFDVWTQYVADARDHIIFSDSQIMTEVETQYGTYLRHYASYASNSPKASGFIPIRNVTYNRILERPWEGAEISTEFFVNTSSRVEVPEGVKPLSGAEGVDFHVGNIHVMDCGKLDWCQDGSQWLVFYDTKLLPEDKSIPEDVLPYLRTALDKIIIGMFKEENRL
ncbi:MAG: hypothetical protein HRU19_13625 [Pseudobacteriovorax sp.]|nr:hypothetical protein [Pseudobacteriovorax sp.]